MDVLSEADLQIPVKQFVLIRHVCQVRSLSSTCTCTCIVWTQNMHWITVWIMWKCTWMKLILHWLFTHSYVYRHIVRGSQKLSLMSTKHSIFIYRLLFSNFCFSMDWGDVYVGTMMPAGRNQAWLLCSPFTLLFIGSRGTIEWDPLLIPGIDLWTMWWRPRHGSCSFTAFRE